MHKGIIILVKAETKEEAKAATTNFLECYKENVWDWYEIGGRWEGLLKENIMRLEDCAEKVKEYAGDHIEKAEEELVKANEWKNKNNYGMYGHYLRKAGSLFAEYFYNECNLYNVEMDDYSIPTDVDIDNNGNMTEDIKDYYAVIVDIHS